MPLVCALPLSLTWDSHDMSYRCCMQDFTTFLEYRPIYIYMYMYKPKWVKIPTGRRTVKSVSGQYFGCRGSKKLIFSFNLTCNFLNFEPWLIGPT